MLGKVSQTGNQNTNSGISPTPNLTNKSEMFEKASLNGFSIDLLDMTNPDNIVLSELMKPSKMINSSKGIETKSNILSLPSHDSEDFIGYSDIPIMKICSDMKATKPIGSAFISVKISVGKSNKSVEAHVCIDTGADITLCDSAFLITHFGDNVLKNVVVMAKPPKLRSASGHCLKILGRIRLVLFLGEYELNTHVIVHEGKANIFLLGSDSFYDRLIFDRGMFLAFADKKYPPIPIQYELSKGAVKALSQYQIAPKSHALIQVKIVNSAQFAGREVVLSPLTENESKCDHSKYLDSHQCVYCYKTPVRNTVSVIDSQGNSLVLIENDTDDILTIKQDTEIANADLISSDGNYVHQIISSDTDLGELSPNKLNKQWPISALTGELKEKLPSNVIVQWDMITKNERDNPNNKSKESCNDNNLGNENSLHIINYVHDKEERKNLLDGKGEGFPTPPSAGSVHPEQNLEADPEAWLENVEHSHLTKPQWIKLKAVLVKYREAFSKSKTEIGCCNYFKVDLPLKPGTGYLYNKPRPLPFKHREVAAETISELLAKGVIRPSKSPHATNIVCVEKKTMNGVESYRVCCDLRQVNENSIPNRFPNFWIEDAMSKIQGAAYRSALDFKDAFHMLVLTEESIPVTAFYFNNVLFEYVRVPFGHICAMNAFCCLMALLCVGYDSASYYADDLMITTKTDHLLSKDQLFNQHLDHIGGMLARIIEAGLKLVAHKCQWCYDASKPMEWLGFTMENNLLKPQESKVKAIQEFPVPSSAKQVISFISTASFYRRFIKSFAKEVQPMYTVAHSEPFQWNNEAQKSFEKLKEIMCSDLVLRLPRQGEPFQIYSDASAGAIGVVLCQIDPIDKKSHPCAYGSRKFNECEMKLSIPCKELLAIVYGLNLWSFYICGNPIQVFSDCRAWTFLNKQSGASGKISRLALLISEYDISISYVKGTKNMAADGLSRAYDDGLVKYDDQITARHPALNKLQAPELPPGEILKLSDYLVKCDKFLESHWPKILKEYEDEHPMGLDNLPNLKKDENPMGLNLQNLKTDENPMGSNLPKLTYVNKLMIEEADYVDQIIQEAAILHVDKSNSADLNKRLKVDNYYPFQVNNDYIYEDSVVLSDESEPSDTSDVDEFEEELNGTTDSSFKAACYNIRLVAINESSFSLEAFAEMQDRDEFCSAKIEMVRKKNTKTINAGYFLKRKILMRKMETKDGQVYNVICVPNILVKPLLESSHRSLLSGHFGSQRYFLNMSRKYYWPKMRDDIVNFHHQCVPCQYNDKFPIKYMSGYVIRPLWPMHVVHCDLVVGLPRALDGSTAILLLYDGFSRFTFGIALTSEKADYVVKKLMSHFVAAFGLPWALHSDNGRNIDGSLIRHLALMLGVLKTSTPPHTPNANPTETMCGAVSQLLRKGLNESDKRYWSLCLPFVLNALNSTVHTATGFTPNSLFFGRFQEREPVPLIPFDSESANVNEYFQKMRRFQELAFQIARSRNERKLQAKKTQWDKTARSHPYQIGDFVLVKNKNPASGPGKKKLRAIYVGPFRVIKAYVSSLIVVPWTENARLEEYYKDPDVFRLMHRGDIKPFHTRQVSVKHCKPFHGNIEAEKIVDPIMLTRFLDALGVDSQDEILSEIDSESQNSKDSSKPPLGSDDSSNHSPPPPGGRDVNNRKNKPRQPPRPNSDNDSFGPDPEPDVEPIVAQPMGNVPQAVPLRNPEPILELENAELTPDQRRLIRRRPGDPVVDRLLDNLDLQDDDRILMRNYYQEEEDMATVTMRTRSHRQKINELEQLVRSADPAVRERAEFELTTALEQLRFDANRYRLSFDNLSDSSEENRSIHTGVERDDLSEHDVAGMPDLESGSATSSNGNDEGNIDKSNGSNQTNNTMEWEQEHPLPAEQAGAWGANQPTPEVQILMPNVAVTIRQTSPRNMDVDPFARKSRLASSPAVAARRQVQDWLSGVSPLHGAGPDAPGAAGLAPVMTPIVTRHGRISNPVHKFDIAAESQRQRDLRDIRNLNKPVTARKVKPATATITQPSAFVQEEAIGRSPVKPSTSKQAKDSSVKPKAKSGETAHEPVNPSTPSEDQASRRSTKTARTPVGANKDPDDQISRRSTKTARTPVGTGKQPEPKTDLD